MSRPYGCLLVEKKPSEREPLRFSFKWFDEVSSTSDVARKLAESGAAKGTVVVSKRQKAGRGRFSRRWFSPAGGLYFTMVLRPDIPASQSQLLGAAAALAAADAVELATLTSPQLKWPNDVFLLGKKVGGILAETRIAGAAVKLALLGVGLNVQRPEAGVPDSLRGAAIWLSDLEGKAPDVTKLLTAVLGSFTVWYQRLLSCDFAAMKDAYNRRSLLTGKDVRVLTREGVVVGRCKGADCRGALLLENEVGNTVVITQGHVLCWGEVCSWS